MIEQLGILIENIGQFIEDNAPVVADKLKEWGNAFVKWVEESWPVWLDKAEGFITDVLGWLGEQVPILYKKLVDEWIPAFLGWANDLWNGTEGKEGLLSKLTTFAHNIPQWITERAIEYHLKFMEEWLPAFVDWAKEVGPGVFVELWKFTFDLMKFLWWDLPIKLVEAAVQVGASIVDGIIDGIRQQAPGIQNLIYDIVDGIGIKGLTDFLGLKKSAPTVVGTRVPATGQQGNRVLGGVENTLSNIAVGAGVGSSIITNNNNPISSIANNNNFAPTINGVPADNAEALNQAIWNSWQSAQAVG